MLQKKNMPESLSEAQENDLEVSRTVYEGYDSILTIPMVVSPREITVEESEAVCGSFTEDS